MASTIPDPNALRRDRPDDAKEWTILPANGRQGDTPTFPLQDYTSREAVVWAKLWQTPQAAAWDANNLEWEVAFFVRRLVQAEVHGSSSQNATLVRQQMDSLGLSMSGMRSNRWRLSSDEVNAARLAREPLPSRNSSRNRAKRVA